MLNPTVLPPGGLGDRHTAHIEGPNGPGHRGCVPHPAAQGSLHREVDADHPVGVGAAGVRDEQAPAVVGR
jgi:hypothetical protein